MAMKFRAVAFALAALGLFACDRENLTGARPVDSNGSPQAGSYGSARIQLPALPPDSLGDSARDSSSLPLFLLTISGNDMEARHYSWRLSYGYTPSIALVGLPAGSMRYFSSRIVRRDAPGDTATTHEGWDSAAIRRGAVTDVTLRLRLTAKGSVRFCVQVEGWPNTFPCRPSDTLIPPIDTLRPPIDTITPPGRDSLGKPFTGCWKVRFRGQTGTLQAWQTGKKTLAGAITWGDGGVDSLSGILDYLYLNLYASGAHGPRNFRGNVLPLVNHFEAKLLGTVNQAVETLIGDRGACDPVNPPDTVILPPDTVLIPRDSTFAPQDTLASCWYVSQTLANGKGGPGLFLAKRVGTSQHGVFLWNGYPEMRVTSNGIPAMADAFYLWGDFPGGMGGKPAGVPDPVHYKAKISADGDTLMYGTLYKYDATGTPAADGPFGTWNGVRHPCTASEIANLRTLP
jgi:hypothetical protein